MADTKISAMASASTLTGSENVPLVQGGTNVQTTTGNLVAQVLDVTPVTVAQGGTNATTAAGARTNLGLGTIATQNSDNVSITGGSITGTTVAGYVPTSRTLTASTGLSGGGDLTANRSFAIANTGVTAATYGSSTKIPVVTVNAQGQITNASEQTLSAAAINANYFSAYQDGETTLTAAIPNSTSTSPIQVVSTANFQSSGYIIIGEEIIGYTSTTPTAFDGTITRGALSTSKSGHSIGAYATEAAIAPAGTAETMLIDTVIVSNGVTCTTPDSKIYFTESGIYNIQFSAQILNYTSTIDSVTIWLRKDGDNVSYSAGVVEIPAKHGTTPGAVIAGWNYVDQFNSGEYVELTWSSVTGESALATFPQGSSPTRPAAPSLIVTVTQIA